MLMLAVMLLRTNHTDDSDNLGLQSVSVIEDLELHGSSAGKIVVDIDPSYPEGIIFVPYE